MMFSVMPATAAFAQAAPTARLVSASSVFPGIELVEIEVRNNDKPVIGRNINAVAVNLPTSSTGMVVLNSQEAGSFKTVQVSSDGTKVTFRGGCIAPQGVQRFFVAVTVPRPARTDLSGSWVVQVSSDNMATSTNAVPPADGTLTSTVKALELVPKSLRPIAPTNADNTRGVTDGSGTGGAPGRNGQTITYGWDVRNHAREPIAVTGLLESGNSLDRPGPAVVKTIAGNGAVTSFSVPVTLGEAPTDRSNVFVLNLSAPGAPTPTKMSAFNIQQPAEVSLTNLHPVYARSGAGSAREFTVAASKVGAGFDLANTALTFGTNVAAVKDPPARFAKGVAAATLAYQIPEITGAEGPLDATVALSGKDDNLAPVNVTKSVGAITIDNNAPSLTVPLPVLGTNGKDADGDTLVAASDGTRVTVGGAVVGTGLDPGTLKVWLQPDVGPAIPVPMTTTPGPGGGSFGGSVSGGAVTWVDGATRFSVVAEIADEAGNVGTGQSGFTSIDQAPPVIDGNAAVITSPTTVRLEWDDQTGIRGGCDPRTYGVGGSEVTEVRDSSGENCKGKSGLSQDGVRILVLRSPLGADETPGVTYSVPVDRATARAAGYEPVKDGAANDAATQTVSTINDVIPPAPNLTNPQRKDHLSGAREAAYFDAEDGRYYTNVGGADAISATVGGIRHTNYKIQVLDGSGTVLATYDANDKPAMSPLASEWSQQVLIPLGTTDATYVRSVRLVSSLGKASAQTVARFVLDTAKPTIGDSALAGPGEAFGYFNEKVVAGTNNSNDWFATWTMVSEGEARPVHTQVLDVRTVDGQNLTARRATFEGIDENAFRTLDYSLQNPSSVRYEDRAGNLMPDTVTFADVG